MADYEICTQLFDNLINHLDQPIRDSGDNFGSNVKMLIGGSSTYRGLEYEASKAERRCYHLLLLARHVKKATSPHSSMVNAVMNHTALFLFERSEQNENFRGAEATTIFSQIRNDIDEVHLHAVESGLEHLEEHGVVAQTGGLWFLVDR